MQRIAGATVPGMIRSRSRSRLSCAVSGLLALAAATSPLIATAAAASRPAGVFQGRTSQGIVVKLGSVHASRRSFRYQARMACSDGSSFLDDPFTDVVAIRRGRFSSRFSSSAGAVLTTVTGTLRGRRAGGTIRIVERYSEIPNPNGTTPLDATGADPVRQRDRSLERDRAHLAPVPVGRQRP